MPGQVRVGVVGTSWWADLLHLPSLKSHPEARLAAICGRNRERAEEMAQKYGVDEVYTDYRAMIQRGNLDALVVSVPDDLHHPITLAALDAGLHVLCEKPMALSVAQAREMVEQAEAAGVKHMLMFTYRWLPHYTYVKQLIDEGYIGRLLHCHIRYISGSSRAGQYRWKADSQRALGTLGDYGSHMVDLARWYFGDFSQVTASVATLIERPGPDGQPFVAANDNAALLLTFQDGAPCVIQLSSTAYIGNRRQEQHLVLSGENGTLEISQDFARGVQVLGARAEDPLLAPLNLPGSFSTGVNATRNFSEELADLFTRQTVGPRLFVDAILNDSPVSPTFYDGLKVQEVLNAALEASQTGCAVTLP